MVRPALAARRTAQLGLSTLVVERKSFPRSKVCGACLNHRAISVLQSAGLAHIVHDCGGEPINRFWLRGHDRQLERGIPEGVALSRSRFDSALIQAAIEAGVTFLAQANAKVLPSVQETEYRMVRLASTNDASPSRCRDRHIDVKARVVIAADGLGHPSLRQLAEFSEKISPQSRVGIGTTIDDCDATWLRSGTIHMAVGRSGYAGLVHVENGRLNIAAAVDSSFLKSQGSPALAFDSIRREAGFPELKLAPSRWMGTPALSRVTNCVAHNRVLVVGDAAGYVEPFTGEGMTWALGSGDCVGRSAVLAVTSDAIQAARVWQQTWEQLVYRRQKWCRRLAWLLRHPNASRLALSALASHPQMTNPIVNQLNLEPSAR